jgi:putative membrane protein
MPSSETEVSTAGPVDPGGAPTSPSADPPLAGGDRRAVLAQVARGFFMGSADVVPGVSGGTVALVLGIYERLVGNIRQGSAALARLARLDRTGFAQGLRLVDWWFLLPLLVGVGAAVATLAHLIERGLEEYPVPMAALFFGLVAGSVIVACRMLEEWTPRRVALLLGVMAVTALLLGLQSSERADAPLWLFGLAGAIAICAMILPGVSGSFLLLTIGMYELVLSAVTDRDLVTLAVFALGCVVGLALFSSGLSWALERHRDTVLAALVGLMIGSLRVLWPWPAGTDNTELAVPGEQWGLALAIAVMAFLSVVVVSEMGERRKERASQSVATV